MYNIIYNMLYDKLYTNIDDIFYKPTERNIITMPAFTEL